MAKVLYISYDGLTDPLGQSQILPYVIRLARNGHEITIVSCDKPDRYEAQKTTIQGLIEKENIEWVSVLYKHGGPLDPVINKRKLKRKCFEICASQDIQFTHCRSYIPGIIGFQLKKSKGIPFVFDMRGFWADERVDGGLWNLNKPRFNTAYKYFKRKEKEMLANADHIVVLTDAAKEELSNIQPSTEISNVSVIPCCADDQHFSNNRIDEEWSINARQKWGLENADIVIGYLGSLGTWYETEEMIRFYETVQTVFENAIFLIATQDTLPDSLSTHTELGKSIHVTSLNRNEVPSFISLLEYSIFFIKPAYSKMASSPTKLGEILMMDVPVIANTGVGDLESFFTSYEVGYTVELRNPSSYDQVANKMKDQPRIQDTRDIALKTLSNSIAEERYLAIYSRLSNR